MQEWECQECNRISYGWATGPCPYCGGRKIKRIKKRKKGGERK
jgi:rubrerythrin